MSTRIDLLFQYAQKHRMAPLLAQAGLFSRYLDHQAQSDLEERLALFRCGLTLGRELWVI